MSRVELSFYKWRWEDVYEYEIEKSCKETDDTWTKTRRYVFGTLNASDRVFSSALRIQTDRMQ